MNRRVSQTFVRGAFLWFALLAAETAFAPSVLAQNQQNEPRSGAPRSWQGRPGGPPPNGMPAQGAGATMSQPQGMPAVGTPGAAAARPLPPSAAPGKKTPAGEQFFIVASVDLQKSQLLLKYPTEVTVLMHIDESTKLVDESGRPLKLSDFRAGDTVWASSRTSGDETTALHIRKCRMDVADLHRYYLDYAEIK
jgi:hypothetical protein